MDFYIEHPRFKYTCFTECLREKCTDVVIANRENGECSHICEKCGRKFDFFA